jgi:hypothetical protein
MRPSGLFKSLTWDRGRTGRDLGHKIIQHTVRYTELSATRVQRLLARYRGEGRSIHRLQTKRPDRQWPTTNYMLLPKKAFDACTSYSAGVTLLRQQRADAANMYSNPSMAN